MKIWNAYRDPDKSEYKSIHIKHDAQTLLKYMYLNPVVKPGDVIKRGDRVGYVQDLTKIYPETEDREAITNHVHFEVVVEGVHVNPINWLDQRGWL